MCPALLKCRAHFKTATANWAAPLGQAGADYNSAIESSVLFTATTPMPSFQSWDLTSLTQQWLNGAANNYGVILLADNENQIAHDLRFHSADSTPNSVNQPVLEVVWTQQQRSVYYLKDHLGSVRASVDDNGQLLSRDDYDPWGLQLAGRSMTAQPNLPNKFTGKEWDEDFGLNVYHIGARRYDPEIGRWWSVDPLQNTLNPVGSIGVSDFTNSPYVYVNNAPINIIDPDGLCGGLCLGLAFAGALIADAIAPNPANAPSEQDVAQGRVEQGKSDLAFAAQEAAGAGLGALASGLISKGLKTVRNFLKGADDVAQVTTEVVERAMVKQELAATQETGLLRGGRTTGEHHVTGTVNSSTKRAQQRLALPNRPEMKVKLEIQKGVFPQATRVQASGGLPGGGLERKVSGKTRVPVKILKVKKLK